MDTKNFLGRVVPSEGFYIAAKPTKFTKNGVTKSYYKHTVCRSVDELADECLGISASGFDTLYALASFEKESYIDPRDGKTKRRTQSNAKALRCFWLDIDCGPEKDYATQAEGLKALKKALKKLGFPKPSLIVNSGYGLHVYWTFTSDVVKLQWQKVANVFEALFASTDLTFDPVSTDAARVLRPVGTNNYKRGGNKPVKILDARDDYRFNDLAKVILGTAKANNVQVKNTAPKKSKTPDINSALTGGIDDFPPSDANKIANRCAMLKAMRENKGADQGELTWYNALGILRHCENGEAVAHDWSSGHRDYSKLETDVKIAQWDGLGPTLCDTVRKDCDLCGSCKLKCKSPIVLGQPDPVHQTEIIATSASMPPEDASNDDASGGDDDDDDLAVVESLPHLPAEMQGDYAWNEGRGLLARITDMKSDPPVDIWVPVCSQFPVPDFIYFHDKTETYNVRIKARTKPFTWFTGDIGLDTMGKGGQTLVGELGGRCGVTVRDEGKLLVRYMKTWVDILRNSTDLKNMCDRMGWQEDGESFLLGHTLYRPKQKPVEVVIARSLANVAAAHTPKGDKQVFIDCIDKLYNKPNFYEYQFTYLAGFGSPLMKLLHSHSMGITHAMWSNGTGPGKSTVSMAAIANFGDPSGNGQKADGEGGGATQLAMTTMAGQRNNLPVLVDEATSWGPKKIGEWAYRFSSGLAKQQAKAEGGMRDNSGLNWNSVCFLTSNDPVASALMSHRRDCQAQLARVFDVRFYPRNLDTNDQKYIDRLWQNTGNTGAEFIKYVVDNREKVAALLEKMRTRLYEETGLNQEARFWIIYASSVLVGGLISQKLGHHKFDMKALHSWVIKQIKNMSITSVESIDDVEDTLRDMMADKQPGMIVTMTEPAKVGDHTPFAEGYGAPRMTITGRFIVSTGDIYMPKSEVKSWCAKHSIDMNSFRDNLKAKKWLKSEDVRYFVGKGTTVSTTRVRCWHLNWEDTAKMLNIISGDFESNEANELAK